MLGQKREAEQESQEVGQQHPFGTKMREPACAAFAFGERREADFPQRHDDEPADRDRQGVVMEQRDPDERHREQNKVDRDAGQRGRFDGCGPCNHRVEQERAR